jgi:hypothetical protein
MLSLSQFKANLLSIARIMVRTGMYVDVSYKGRLYRITMEDLNQELVKRRRPRRESLVNKIEAKKCPECKKLMLNGVCMSSLCPSRTKSANVQAKEQPRKS